jgi:hypothetical protein
VTQFSITCFDREGIRLAFRNFISAEVIPKAIIGIKSVTIINLGLGRTIYRILDGLLGAFPDHIPAEKAAGMPIYECDDVDPVFLSPIKVNSSSISASFTSSGLGASGKLSACA